MGVLCSKTLLVLLLIFFTSFASAASFAVKGLWFWLCMVISFLPYSPQGTQFFRILGALRPSCILGQNNPANKARNRSSPIFLPRGNLSHPMGICHARPGQNSLHLSGSTAAPMPSENAQ